MIFKGDRAMNKRLWLIFIFLILILTLTSVGCADVPEGTTEGESDSVEESTIPNESPTEESREETLTESAVESKSESITETITEKMTEETSETEVVTETETEEEDVLDIVDFVVSVPTDREPVILQLTDTQIIDASQCRTQDRIGASSKEYWGADKKDLRCYNYLREIIEAVNPDLILLTGDLVYGEFDDNGSAFTELVEFMESYGIPWAPVFGNHDNESKMGVDWQCKQLEDAENCLFLQRELTGNGNYTVGIEQGGRLTRVFFMLDTNGCGNASAESLVNGHTKQYFVGFGADQISWYTETAKQITTLSPETKLSFAFHIQPAVFGEAFAKYDTNGKTQVHIDLLEERDEGDFGFIGAAMKSPWDSDCSVWKGLVSLGVDSVFVGHEHANSASIVYEGIRLQYGMKSSAYDRLNYIDAYGNIASTSCSTNTPWIGGSYFKLSSDGSITEPDIYYCKDAGGDIDWSEFEKYKNITVSGLQKDTDLTADGAISLVAVELDGGITAYEATAISQGKVYIKTALLQNKSSFTFSVLVPAESSAKLGGLGEFAIRVKPNDLEPEGDGGTYIGYIDYDSSSSIEGYTIKFDTWQTFTVDISNFGESCTEFAFVIAKGNKIYLKDLAIE